MSIATTLTQTDFNLLNFENKIKTIYNSGEFIDSHITSVGESKILIFYRFIGFQVEVVYDERATSIKAINSIKLGSKMEHFEPEFC